MDLIRYLTALVIFVPGSLVLMFSVHLLLLWRMKRLAAPVLPAPVK